MRNPLIIEEILSEHAYKLYKELNADQMLIINGINKSITSFEIDKKENVSNFKITVLSKGCHKEKIFYVENKQELNFESKIKEIIIKAIKLNHVKKDSKIILVYDDSISREMTLGTIVLEVSKVLYRIAKFKLSEFMENETVLEKIINIAEEIRNEGREGKKVGALFVIGDEKELNKYIKPLILNPFHGYPEEIRDLFKNDLTETIKEYAQLDGAFIINNKGIIVSAGTYIDIDTSDVKRYYGWGTKHLAAVAITSKTNSIAVLISESGNLIKIFKNGKLILKY